MYKNNTKQLGIPPGYIYKILLIMRLTTVLLIATIMQVSAGSFAQKISLNEKNAPLEKIFDKIRVQSGYDFLFNRELLKTAKPVDINIKNADIEDALELCFKGQPFTYTLQEKTIVIKAKTPSFLERVVDHLAAIDVHGRVVDKEGKPLSGATVKVKSTGKSFSTNAKGEFYLEKLNEDEILVISFIGYVNKEVSAAKEMGDVVLNLSDSKLDEVQVIAYGETTRRLSTGNVSTVKAEDIAKQPVNNPLYALQGRVPGLFIEQATGLPGSVVKVRIQGQNSIGKGNEPLYVLDGVPYASQLLPSVNNNLGVGGGSPLNFINPADIESIDVLKDADATSIYGSRAANGAILITTKKGKAGSTKVDMNVQNGWGQVTRKMKLLNTPQYLQMRREAFKNDGIDLNIFPFNTTPYIVGAYPDLAIWNNNADTDWQKELIGGTAGHRDITASVSGGNANTNFVIGSTYHRENTVFPTDYKDTKASVHFNINSVSGNQKFKVNLSGNYMNDHNFLPGIPDFTSVALRLAPNAPALYNTDGTLNWAPYLVDSTTISTWDNPLAVLNRTHTIKTNNLMANGNLSYQILPDLNIKGSFGYTNLLVKEIEVRPSTAGKPETRTMGARTSLFADNNINSWIVEPQITYYTQLGKNRIDVLLGTTFQNNSANGLRLEAKGFNSDLVMEDIRSATSVTPLPDQGTTIYTYRYNAVFGRIGYNFDDKYLVNVSVRRDGSSRFGANSQFHNFGSIGIGWLFSNENLIKQLPFLSFGKLKASYGTTGNDQIGDYQFLSLYVPTSADAAYQGAAGLQTNNLPNPYFQWEETKKINIGLDLGFFKDRILASFNYNCNRSSNQLLSLPLAYTAGFPSIAANLPAKVQNTGWEFSLNGTNIKSRNFNWISSFNLTVPKNKLVSFPDLENSGFFDRLIIGQSLNVQKVYQFHGVNASTGLYEYKTKDGKLTSMPDFGNDRISIINNNNPELYGGFQNLVRYKKIQLDFSFAFVKQKGINYKYGTYLSGQPYNQPASVLDAWHKPGDVATIQRYVTNFNVPNILPAYWLASSDAIYSDASYIRLRNAALSWQLPNQFIKKLHFEQARIFVQGQNLLTITNYQGLDPENRSTSLLPPLRILTTGIQLTL